MRGYDFFISYTRHDDALGPLANDLYEKLTEASHTVFLDTQMPPGKKWGPEVENALQTCKVFVILLTEISMTREMVIEEVKRIKSREQNGKGPIILPVRVNFNGELPYKLGAYLNPITTHSWATEADTNILLETLRTNLKNPETPQPANPQLSDSVKSPPAQNSRTPQVPATQNSTSRGTVQNSGSWIMLGDHFHQSKSVRENGETITIVIEVDTPEEEAVLRGLKSAQFRGPLQFAHGNNSCFANVRESSSVSTSASQTWTLELRAEPYTSSRGFEVGFENLSANDLAKLRAERLLLNHHPTAREEKGGPLDVVSIFKDSMIAGTSGGVRVERCVFLELQPTYGTHDSFLEFARLRAVFLIQNSGIANEIHELAFSGISEDEIQVKFRGLRAKQYTNVPPEPIAVEGICPLPPLS